MAKPTGSQCNLNCDYCFYLKKSCLCPNSTFRMTSKIMETYIRQTIAFQNSPSVTIAWQGGEPTLMGIDFFRSSIETINKTRHQGVLVENTLQTNGVLIDEEWYHFLHDNNFLVGVSIDGPKHLHDVYRKDKAGGSVFDRVVEAVRLMQKYAVDFNVPCTINISIVERNNTDGNQQGNQITEPSVNPRQYAV